MPKNKQGFAHILVVVIVFAIIAAGAFVLVPTLRTKIQETLPSTEKIDIGLEKVGKIAYSKETSFNTEALTDITKIEDGEIVGSIFNEGKTVIPPKSRVKTFIKTLCMDERFPPPHADGPMLFSYEKIDMPLFFELNAYLRNHPEVDKGIAQRIVWELSEQIKFDGFYPEEQEILLKVDPNAEKIINSYEFNRNITKRAFDFGEEIPKDIEPQPIPGTQLFAKALDIIPYDGMTVEIYNPTDEPQNFSTITEAGIFSAIPAGWVQPIDWENLTFYLAAGQIDISEGYLKTPSDTGAILVTGDSGGRIKGSFVFLYPNVRLSSGGLEEALQKSGTQKSPSSFLGSLEVQAALPTVPGRPDQKPEFCTDTGEGPASEYCGVVCKGEDTCDAEPVSKFSDVFLDRWRTSHTALKGETGQRVQAR